ncbi:hypothetical protein SPRG_04664 [Saprolegnia parasitica CBS 223.65]|uniref:Uncharacterized protein n=1 Tax=Saprolegnia parasitica (strain CBS 223.65) TaxID=695850 RepID=A0A067CJU6_SAPPC|nr:hypothetical protein SPRG_04664 [Saprolegnia parasitica CBS 223.65]KDO30763.1 hypothetical protein SPRG_04664 [Saprolegnia parasitica CBS 223.65]|eukprot:XP_012198462.1 hypothetical protein SPRG_04664 [Saprolegnia parasitica CBS 223.65]
MAPTPRSPTAHFQRFTPYSPKRPSLVEHELYVEAHSRGSDSIATDPVTFDEQFHLQLRLDDDDATYYEPLTPRVSDEWNRDEVDMFLNLPSL